MIVQKQGLHYCSATPSSSSCTQEHAPTLNESCCLSLVVPGPFRTIGPLLAFGPGPARVSSAAGVTCVFGTIGPTESSILYQRPSVLASQITYMVSVITGGLPGAWSE